MNTTERNVRVAKRFCVDTSVSILFCPTNVYAFLDFHAIKRGRQTRYEHEDESRFSSG